MVRKIALEGRTLEHMKFCLHNDVKLLKKVFELMDAIRTDPFKGISKPEPLKNELKGY